MQFLKSTEIQGHSGAIYSGVVDSTYIYTGSADKYVARWFPESGEQDKFAIKFEQSVYALEMINETLLAVGLSDGGMHVFDLVSRKEIKYFTQHTKAIFCIRSNPKYDQLYVTDADGNLSVWDTRTFKLLIYLPLDCGKIRDVKISPDGEHFCLAAQDGTLRIFDVYFFNEVTTFHAHQDGATSLLYTTNNQIISGGKDAHLRSWNISNGQLLKEVPAHNFAIYDLLSIDNEELIISASRDKTIKIWDKELNFIQRLDHKEGGHRHSVNGLLKLSEQSFASISDDKKVLVWKPRF